MTFFFFFFFFFAFQFLGGGGPGPWAPPPGHAPVNCTLLLQLQCNDANKLLLLLHMTWVIFLLVQKNPFPKMLFHTFLIVLLIFYLVKFLKKCLFLYIKKIYQKAVARFNFRACKLVIWSILVRLEIYCDENFHNY